MVQIRGAGFVVLTGMTDVVPRARLLLVEDDPDTLEVLCLVLGEKYDVFGYPSPVEALEALEVARPDVLLLDIGMPPIDGMQCLRKIRSINGYCRIPAVAFTGFARAVEQETFLAAGFQSVVVKPARHPSELVTAIDTVLAARSNGPPEGGTTLDEDGTMAPNSGGAPAKADGSGAA